MKIDLFYHSLVSDWNHGNAHFLRGVAKDLVARGHEVLVHEPRHSWSRMNLVSDHGEAAANEFYTVYPGLKSVFYEEHELNLEDALKDTDLVIVHEWNSPGLVKNIGLHRKRHSHYRLLFHDTHHRMVTDFESMKQYDLRFYDGVLAFGRVIAELYRTHHLAHRAWTWHEAADTTLFKNFDGIEREGDLIWIGNWGDHERTEELHEFLINPVSKLKLKASVHGVRYPDIAKQNLAQAGIDYRGWIPNYRTPERFSKYRMTVHVPRRPYVKALPGIPTIRMFEALACKIPLISAPWEDNEGLFRDDEDYWIARNGKEMESHVRTILNEPAVAQTIAERGLETIRARHTCAHRVDELLSIHEQLHKGSTA